MSDGSLDILDMVREYIEYPTFHCLLGNHEWSQIWGDDVYRFIVNQTEEFKNLVEDKFPDDTTFHYIKYIRLLKEFKPSLITSNGLFIIHSGIHEDYLEPIINDSVNIYKTINFKDINEYEREVITEHLWCRPYDDYMEDTISEILEYLNCQFMISGHTPYNGYHILGNQLIFDSSHNTEHKYYLKVKLNKKYNNIINLIQQCLKEKGE